MSILNNLNPQFNPLGQMPQLQQTTLGSRTPQQMQSYNQLLQNYAQPQMIRPGNSVSAQTANTSMQAGVPFSDSTILFNPEMGRPMGNPQGGYDGGGINPVIGPNGERLIDYVGNNASSGPYYSDLPMGEGGFNPGETGNYVVTGDMTTLQTFANTGEVGMADPTPEVTNNAPAATDAATNLDPMPESALSQLDPIPDNVPNTGLLGYEEAVGGGYDDAVTSLLNAYRGSEGVQGSERL